jgi:hypothetical protein
MNENRRHEPLLVGCAAGFSGDRVDAAGPVVDTLIARGGPAYLIFETLAERTLAFAQLVRREHPHLGYEPLLDDILRPVLARCLQHRIGIVSNFGAANPRGAALRIMEIARELGIAVPRIAVVSGDDVSGPEHRAELVAALRDGSASGGGAGGEIVAANAYQGADAIAAALRAGAQIVVTGRVADPALTVGPAMAHFGWHEDDWACLGRAVLAGHLLECGAQITGGYFADPGFKDVPDLHDVGFPIAEIAADGSCTIGKADRTGGFVTEQTVKEQILYEMHDPAAYLSPDAVADVSKAVVRSVGRDRVQVSGITGRTRPEKLKVNVYYDGGWLAEGEISYAGPRAEGRARLAADVLRRRLGPELDLRVDLIGVASVFGDDAGRTVGARVDGGARDVRLRVAAAHPDAAQARRLEREVNALYTCGPAGGGGVRTALRRRLSMRSCLFPRASAPSTFEMIE